MVIVPKTVALLDACVLYPPSLRDLLMRLAAARVDENLHEIAFGHGYLYPKQRPAKDRGRAYSTRLSSTSERSVTGTCPPAR